MQQQSVAGDIEWNTQENICAALIKLTGKLAVCDVELEESMARRQRHVFNFTHIPGTDNQAAGIRVVLNLFNYLGDLIHVTAIRCRPATPLRTVYRPEVSFFVCPLIPDRNAILFQITDIGITAQEPEKFMNDGAQVQLFGGHQREAFTQIKAHLVAETTVGTRSCAVFFKYTVFTNVTHQIEVLFHALLAPLFVPLR